MSFHSLSLSLSTAALPTTIYIPSLRQYHRSESARSFDEVEIKKARLHSLGLAYLSSQNKSLAQSFR